MKNTSLSDKLIFCFISIGVIVIVIIGTYYYYNSKTALLNRTFDQLMSLRLEKKNRIEQFFLDRERDIKLISESAEVRRILKILNLKKDNHKEWNELKNNTYLNKYISSYGYYQNLYIINSERLMFGLNEFNDNKNGTKFLQPLTESTLLNFCDQLFLEKKIKIHDLTKSRLLLYLGAPIIEDNITLGVVVLEIPVSAINNIMFGYTENNGLGETGETYLVGNDFLMRSNSRFKKDAIFNIKAETKGVKNALMGIENNEIIYDYRNISCLSSYSALEINGLNWVILAEIDEQEAMIPIYKIRNNILLISIVLIATVFIFALILSRKITSPIKRLQKATEQLGKGNYDVVIEVTSEDEIGLLSNTFNKMILQLKKQKQLLEEEKQKRFRILIDGQEFERQRLARDLHDSLGQSILAAIIKIEQIENCDAQKIKLIADETIKLLKDTIQEIRNISSNLMPSELEAFGLEFGLKKLCRETALNTGINIDLICTNIPQTLNKRIVIYLFRISQEAINNIVKHAKATNASIKIHKNENYISLTITDNGKGFDSKNHTFSGNGLFNIKSRVELLKGEFSIISKINEGTTLSIKIPTCKEKKYEQN